ncbi:MAG TPA: hypothetical protein VG674_22835 [Amycolatopsis sp.]|nr:hypothetical protein [Amycolatopsis sp.]
MAGEGLVTATSDRPVGATVDRPVELAEAAGLVVFARIDHAANAAAAGLPLRPMQLLVFGHGRGGTPSLVDARPAASTCRSRPSRGKPRTAAPT